MSFLEWGGVVALGSVVLMMIVGGCLLYRYNKELDEKFKPRDWKHHDSDSD